MNYDKLSSVGWQTVYENDLLEIVRTHSTSGTVPDKSKIRGAEVALWTENVSH